MEESTQTPSAPSSNSNSGMGKTIAILALVVVGAIGAFVLLNNQPQTPSPAPSPTPTQVVTQVQPTAVVADAAYKDGDYSVVGKYVSPGGDEELGVTLTLKDNVVVESSVEVKATRPISLTRQKDFADNYKTMVVGKKISEITLSKVSGSSLTPKGFNDALEQIKTQAKI